MKTIVIALILSIIFIPIIRALIIMYKAKRRGKPYGPADFLISLLFLDRISEQIYYNDSDIFDNY